MSINDAVTATLAGQFADRLAARIETANAAIGQDQSSLVGLNLAGLVGMLMAVGLAVPRLHRLWVAEALCDASAPPTRATVRHRSCVGDPHTRQAGVPNGVLHRNFTDTP